jgi:CBS domain-containing protein
VRIKPPRQKPIAPLPAAPEEKKTLRSEEKKPQILKTKELSRRPVLKSFLIPFFILIVTSLLFFLSLRFYLSKPRPGLMQKQLDSAIKKTIGKAVKDVLSSEVVAIDIEETLQDAMNLMLKKELGSILVLRNRKPIGWVAEQTITDDIFFNKRKLDDKLKNSTLLSLVSVKPEDTLFDAHNSLSVYNVRKAVVMKKEKLLGIITLTDIARAIHEFSSGYEIESESLPHVMAIMNQNVVKVSNKATLRRVKAAMKRNNSDYAIIDDYQLAIITERDILGELAINPKKAATMQASFVAKSHVQSISPYFTAFEANELMLHKFRRLPVICHGYLIGMLLQEDVVRELLAYMKKISDLIKERRHITVDKK